MSSYILKKIQIQYFSIKAGFIGSICRLICLHSPSGIVMLEQESPRFLIPAKDFPHERNDRNLLQLMEIPGQARDKVLFFISSGENAVLNVFHRCPGY